MVQTPSQPLTLDLFLQLPETKPTREFLNGQITQKPMPQGEHSTLQAELCKMIDRIAEPPKIAKAFPELRCVFGGAAIIPDVSVFRWSRIPRSASGRVANRFELAPDWAIAILSPDQPQTKVLANLLHCVEHGTELGWLIDPENDSVLVIFPESRVKLYGGSDPLPILQDLDLTLSVTEIFQWLVFPE
ncbi:MAG: Uma2 family endonuclease [Oculatellaceae cyanobacterium Prado106]|jgi:Uma2 family endonuclease|nr:Uma2 family endonuclease [Oculatellaceae cyanobacterium Prado106]